MSDNRTYLITSATGRQGSAVLDALTSHPTDAIKPSQIYAVTRNPNSPASQLLLKRHPGLHLIKGSLADTKSLLSQLPTTSLSNTAAFLNAPDAPAVEVAEGKSFIDAARAAGLTHIVYSSVDRGADSATEPSWVPHFATKYEVERHLAAVAASSDGALSYTILRPTFFMDNLQWGFLGKVVATGVRDQLAGMRVQMVAARDVGRWAAEALLFPEDPELRNKGFSITSDQLSFEEADAIFVQQTGGHIPTTFAFLSATIIYLVGNVNKMFKWFHDRPSTVDIQALGKRIPPTSFEDWAAGVGGKKSE